MSKWSGGFGTRWISLNVPWGVFGIHGTNRPGSIGSEASHGCIRMLNKDVEELYKYAKLGMIVVIYGEGMKQYVIKFKKDNNLKMNHNIDVEFYKELGIILMD